MAGGTAVSLCRAGWEGSSVQPLSRIRLCDPMDCSTPGFPVRHQLWEGRAGLKGPKMGQEQPFPQDVTTLP